MKRSEIRFVAPPSLINHRIELEVDLVQAPSEVNSKGLAVVSRHNPGQESAWQTPR